MHRKGCLVTSAIRGRNQDLQSTCVALQQGKGPFHWAAHQVLGMALKKVQVENGLFRACNARTCHMPVPDRNRYRWRFTRNGQFSIENK